jgi:hypothetical protein
MVLAPRSLTGFLGVAPASARDTSWAVQMLGAREIALGLGAFTALRRGDARAARLWLAAGLLCDGLDAVVLAAAVGSGRVSAAPGAGGGGDRDDGSRGAGVGAGERLTAAGSDPGATSPLRRVRR